MNYLNHNTKTITMEMNILNGQDIIDFITKNKLQEAQLVVAIDTKGATYVVSTIESYDNLPNTIGFNIELEFN